MLWVTFDRYFTHRRFVLLSTLTFIGGDTKLKDRKQNSILNEDNPRTLERKERKIRERERTVEICLYLKKFQGN